MSTEDKLRGYLKRVTAELLETRERLAAAETAETAEPIAIVGMACRFPGGIRTPEDLWQLLTDGGSVVSGTPEDRNWDLDELTVTNADGSATVRTFGAFLDDATEFDADFFGISPREAVAMDPQHRLLLETAWEALERAGIPADSLHGSRTGAYMGIISGDYAAHLTASGTAGLDGYFINGAGAAFASGRIAYTLGLQGPAVTIDTACSSALVALHDAVRALRGGECATALVGGAAVVSTSAMLVEFGRQGGLAPDGRCKPFGAAADGTAFSEGVGVLVLERLSDARRAGHEVLAVVRGSAVNQDGASNGLTAPNGAAQEQVIRQALEDARLTADQVDAVEAHGTGTVLGDPIEGQALLATYGAHRPDGRPLLLGSVKSNIGHTQAASGLAGTIKTVLALRHGVLPASLGIDEPTPHVDWAAGGLRLLTERTDWPGTGEPRRAGVSSFSLSGTNAHVILEEAPAATAAGGDGAAAPTATAAGDREAAPATTAPAADGEAAPAAAAGRPAPLAAAPAPATPWVLSAKSPAALRAQAAGLLARLDAEPALRDGDIALTLATGRSALKHRAVAVGTRREELTASLAALAAGETSPRLARGTAPAEPRTGAVFVFPGQGPQWAGMGAGLMESSPVFAARVQECLDEFDRHLDWSLADVLRGAPGARALDEDEVVQPALFTMMVGLAALWESCGVRPTAVVGHSQGEIAAACVAGAISLPDAVRIVARRNRPIRAAITGRGGMASLPRPVAEVEELLGRWDGRLTVAAVNGPSATAVSGDLDALRELLAHCAAEGITAHRIPIDYASHSAHIDLVEQELLDTIGTFETRELRTPFYSTVTGGPVEGHTLDTAYWFENLRRPVDFAGAVRALLADGHRAFVECGAHPVLTYGLEELVHEAGADAAVVPTLRRGQGGADRFLTSLGLLHAGGVRVDWPALLAGGDARTVPLPTYAFQRKRFWLDEPVRAAGDVRAAGLRATGHPLLGAAVDLAGPAAEGGAVLHSGRLALDTHPWLADHTVAETPLLPGTATVELAARLAAESGPAGVEELTLHAPVPVPDEGAIDLQAAVGAPDDSGRRSFALYSRPEDAEPGAPWTLHAEGALAPEAPGTPALPTGGAWEVLRGAWPPPGATPVALDGLYDRLAGLGIAYGPAFRGLRALWRRGDELLAEVAPENGTLADAAGHGPHPALLDAALHAVLADRFGEEPEAAPLLVPFAWHGVTSHTTGATALRVALGRDGDDVTLKAADTAGTPVVSVDRLTVRPMTADQLRASGAPHRDALFRLDPTAVPSPGERPDAGACVLLGDAPADPASPLARLPRHADPAALAGTAGTGAPLPRLALVPLSRLLPDLRTSADPADAIRTALTRALRLVQDWVADDRLADTRLVLVTPDEDTEDGSGTLAGAAGAAVRGLVRSAQAEHPGRFVLVSAADPETVSVDALAAAVATGEPDTLLRSGAILAPRLVRVPAASAPATGPAPLTGAGTDPGTVLVTGGLGTLGGLVARHLVTARGVRRLLLVGRRGLDTPGADALVAELTALGAHVTVAARDVSDRAEVAALLDSVPAAHPLTAVVHTAGVVDDGVVTALDPERLDRVLRPKLDAAVHLDELTRETDLSAFVLFSSLSGVLGRAGQANYAAANAFLDGLARRRHRLGLPATALAWGLWAEASDITGDLDEAGLRRLAAPGIAAMTADEALALLDAALDAARAHDLPALVPARLDLPALRAHTGPGEVPPVLRALLGTGRRAARGPETTASTADGPDALRAELAALSEADRLDRLTELVRARAAAVLGHEGGDGDAVDPDRAFKELGFDSLTAVELRNQLGAATGVRLPATLVFDHPTPAALAEFLRTRLADDQAGPSPVAGGPIHAALDHLSTTVSATTLDDATRDQLVARLRELTRAWARTSEPDTGSLESATADEIFSLLDEQFGSA
ncbi:type I polyketide synthase [Streptomyces sp. NPDC127166]|uniref:type I polyketide synthase n=1 Tax=Streptomyces sp. NPDC127166 TaxID=3345380 RepID=UPI00362A76BC